MGSDKSFNDARVLRTDETTLSKKRVRMLLDNLETGDHTLGDLRKLDGIASKMAEALGDYNIEYDRLTSEVNAAVREHGMDSMEFRQASLELGNLATEAGAELIFDVLVTPSEWDWIKERWQANTKLSGYKAIRADVLAIDDVVMHAKGVKLVGSEKRAWVQGEPEPMHAATTQSA